MDLSNNDAITGELQDEVVVGLERFGLRCVSQDLKMVSILYFPHWLI